MNVTFTLDFTGSPDATDVLAARHAIFLENRRRAEQLTPPGTPLPFATPAQVKASYLTILVSVLNAYHQTLVDTAKSEIGMVQRFTPDQVHQMNANLTARLNSGESAASIVTDTA